MSLEVRPAEGASVLTNWLRRLSIYKRVQGQPANQTSLSNASHTRSESTHAHLSTGARPLPSQPAHGIRQGTRYPFRAYKARHCILLAFTQLCRSTRQKFLPWLWEHVQTVCVYSPGLKEQDCRRLAEEMFQGQPRTLAVTPSTLVCASVSRGLSCSCLSSFQEYSPCIGSARMLQD
jgi:hypothetical protein